MVVENRNKGIEVSDDSEVVQSGKEDVAFLYSPSYSKTLKFYDGVSALSVSEES